MRRAQLLPVIFYTDASFEGGNSTPEQIAEAAAKLGLTTIMIHDRNSMSAVLRFSKACKKRSINMQVGIQLSVRAPLLAASFIFNQHSAFFKAHVFDSSSNEDSVKLAFNALEERDSLDENNEQWQKIRKSYQEHTVQCSFFAEDTDGYQSLLLLCSVRSMKKKMAITGTSSMSIEVDEDDESEDEDVFAEADDESGGSKVDLGADYPLMLSDIVEYGRNVRVSIIGNALLTQTFNEDFEIDLSEFAAISSNKAVKLCVDVSEDPKLYSQFVENTKQKTKVDIVLVHMCRYLFEDEYDDYAIKIAAHNKFVITEPSFVWPNRNLRLRDSSTIQSQELRWHDISSVDHTFFDALQPVTIQTGKIELPNFAMPYQEVIKFAFSHEGAKNYQDLTFENDEQAIEAFDAWLKESFDAESATSFSAYRQKKLNDFCLYKLSMEGLESRLLKYGDESVLLRESYLARHQMEFDVISRMGFSGYFLIEYDFVSYARRVGVPVGDGRGSAAGSLIVYALEITDVDPIKFDLQFERFLNPERVSMPDIDVDFGASRTHNRNSVLNYISQKYQQPGSKFPSSSQIANVNAYKLRSAIPKVRAAMGLSMYYDAYLRRIVQSYCQAHGIKTNEDISWDDFLSYEPHAIQIKKEPILGKVFRHARALTGKRSSYGVHAGGVVIAPTVITDFSAIECDASGKIFCQYDKDDIEAAGLVKFDILGLRTLTLIDDAVYQIERDYGKKLDPREFPIDDPAVMQIINSLLLADIFQLESDGMRKLVMRLQPANVSEIAVLSALHRPGALDSKMPEEFVEVKFGRKHATYDHPALETVTKETYGCIVYQEQVMSIVRALAGYSLGEADMLRRAMGKKKIDEMKRHKSIYNGRAQAFWRSHYIEVGEKTGSPVKFDVCLSDLKPQLEEIGLLSCLSSEGYFCDVTEVVPALAKNLLKLNVDQTGLMRERFDNISYVVREFKGHYHATIVAAIQEKLKDHPLEIIEETCVRVYYALSQMVRFNQVFNKVEKFAGYGFNKSHALAYSLVTYRAAWLKRYYPEQFYAAALNMRALAKIEPTVLEMRYQLNIQLLKPDINISKAQFSVDMTNGGVRYGLSKLKGVASSARQIVEHREKFGEFKGLYDLFVRSSSAGIDKTSMHALIKAGALDALLPHSFCKLIKIEPRSFSRWLATIAKSSKVLGVAAVDATYWVDELIQSEKTDVFAALSPFLSKQVIDKSITKLNGYFVDKFISVFSGVYHASNQCESSENNRTSASLDPIAGAACQSYQNVQSLLDDWRANGNSSDGAVRLQSAAEFFCGDDLVLLKAWNTLKERECRSIRINQFVEIRKSMQSLLPVLVNLYASSITLGDSLLLQSQPVLKGKKKVDNGLTQLAVDLLCDHISQDENASSLFKQMLRFAKMSGLAVMGIADQKCLENMVFLWLLSQKSSRDFLPSGWAEKDVMQTWESLWLFILRGEIKSSPMDALTDEYDVAGCYLTQTPAQLINLAQLAEEEPAGSYLDGSPIQVHQIDVGSNDRKVSTWGTIRGVRTGTTKKEDSPLFNEKFMSFELVSENHAIKCSINGTKPVNAVLSHLTDGSLVLISGKVSYKEEYGLSLRVEAFKRYYPDPDGLVRLVPKMNSKNGRKKM